MYGGTCGGSYTSVQYDYDNEIKYVTIETQTYTVIQLPAIKKNVYAGQGVNWKDITSKKIITKSVFDDTELNYEIDKANAVIINNQRKLDSLKCQLKNLESELSSLNSNLDSARSALNTCLSCTPTCVNTDPKTGQCTKYSSCPSCTSKRSKVNSLKSKVSAKESQVTSKKAEIDITEKDSKVANAKANAELKVLKGYRQQADNYGIKISNCSNTSSSFGETLTIEKYTQAMNSIVAISKNNGFPLTSSDVKNIDNETYITNEYDFFIPSYITNNSTGTVSRNVVDDGIEFTYSCNLNVNNEIKTNSGINLIFRPISLTNPFPNTKSDSKYRKLGANWNEILADSYITNNRNVETYNVYNLTPIYTVVLTPSTIKEIRNYNKNNDFNDFKMNCTDGYKCFSEFLWNDFYKIIDTENSCATSSGWDASCI